MKCGTTQPTFLSTHNDTTTTTFRHTKVTKSALVFWNRKPHLAYLYSCFWVLSQLCPIYSYYSVFISRETVAWAWWHVCLLCCVCHSGCWAVSILVAAVPIQMCDFTVSKRSTMLTANRQAPREKKKIKKDCLVNRQYYWKNPLMGALLAETSEHTLRNDGITCIYHNATHYLTISNHPL